MSCKSRPDGHAIDEAHGVDDDTIEAQKDGEAPEGEVATARLQCLQGRIASKEDASGPVGAYKSTNFPWDSTERTRKPTVRDAKNLRELSGIGGDLLGVECEDLTMPFHGSTGLKSPEIH